MSELPKDLIEEILCRVPARSLKRLQSTCQRWNCLVNNKRFTTKHSFKTRKHFMNLMYKESSVCLMRNNLHKSPPVKVKRELSLTDPHSSLYQIKIWQVFHCDGLLLCVTLEENIRLVVWNPCTGQRRWINPCNDYTSMPSYALGSYQDKKSNDISYKILTCRVYDKKQEFVMYEITSDSSRILDLTMDFELDYLHWGVSLKGRTYWVVRDKEEKCLLVSFDYTTERFERLCLLRQFTSYTTQCLSVIREDKLSVLSQCQTTSKTEIWVTNKITETKAVLWTKVLAVDLDPGFIAWHGASFLFDEELSCAVMALKTIEKSGYTLLERTVTLEKWILKEDQTGHFYFIMLQV
ncbi:probable F-box protein At5g47300 [Eutrema salsugineum]|nr:probable F-box protein At5g47300 [Eutrema salsugineum]